MSRNMQSSDIATLRQRLRARREHVDDPDLRQDIQEWLMTSHNRLDADSAAEYVSDRLTSLLGGYKMRDTPETDVATSAFPDDCQECEHYGSACPVLVGPVEPKYRERKLDEATTDAEAKQVFQEQAQNTGCVRIPEFLDEWTEDHSDFIRRGEELLFRAEEDVLEGTEEARVDV